MFDDGTDTNPDHRRRDLHAALDQLLDASVDNGGPVLSEAIGAAETLTRAVDGALVGVLPVWESTAEWSADGYGGPVPWLVAKTGRHTGATRSLRQTALAVAKLPHVSAAAASGALPVSHLRLLAQARDEVVAPLFDRDEAALVEVATRLHADGLRDHLRCWRYAALEELERNDPDRLPPLPEREANRLRLTQTFAGRGVFDGELDPDTYAMVKGAVDARVDGWYRSGILDTDNRSRQELDADAFLEIFRNGVTPSTSHNGPRPLVIGVADLDSLFDRADVDEDDRMEFRSQIVDGGPVATRTIRRLLCDANFSLVITDSDGEPLHVGRNQRTATNAQWRALLVRSGGRCEVPGCDQPHTRCDAHHLIEWFRNGGLTDIDNLAMLCTRHHTAIHENRLIATRGPTGPVFSTRHGGPITADHGYAA